MKQIKSAPLAFILSLALPAAVVAQAEPTVHKETLPDAVDFKPFAIPGFDPGVKLAVLHGDPNAESGDYTLRLWFPAAYKFPAHWHPGAEHLTVLEGNLQLGMGDTYNGGKLTSYPVGSFLYIPAKMAHYGMAKVPTVIQLHGQAPFKIELGKPTP